MAETANLTNQFLIAMPALSDPNFQHSVTLICEHSEAGALGIIINRPLELTVGDILSQLGIEPDDPEVAQRLVLHGGPVQQERGFVLHEDQQRWDSTLQVSPTISVTTSRDILSAMARGQGPGSALVALGYAGWSAGQLEQELSDNAWLSVPADNEIIFRMPFGRRWEAAARLLGIDPGRLSHEAGHA